MSLMDIGDVPFVVGPVFGPVIALIVLVVAVATKRSLVVIVAASVLSLVALASFVTYWWAWGIAFDDLDAGRTVSPSINAISEATIISSATAAALLLVIGISLGLPRGPRIQSA